MGNIYRVRILVVAIESWYNRMNAPSIRSPVDAKPRVWGKRTVPPGQFPLGHFPLPCLVRVRVRTEVSRVRLGSVELGLVLDLGLEL